MPPRKKDISEKSGMTGTAKKIKAPKTAVKAVDAEEPAEKSNTGFPIVGIGASAGGLAAFEAFFSGMPSEADGFGKLAAGPGMAFILVQHLDPNHKSILTDIIRRYTRMQVFEVEDGMIVHPNCVYIIPPNCDMAFLNGTLQLMKPSAPRGQRMPIDFFFRSLAQDQHERAICIILSGTGSDGTLGLRAIKGEGGMAMVQTPGSAEYDGMPRSAIGTGITDYELPPAEMPAQLITYAAHAFGRSLHPATVPTPKTENSLKKIFILLRSHIGHDFSQYKPSTIHRRIERRMAVNQIAMIDEYVKYLQQTPKEMDALFRDLLIGVTNFFRDPDAFKMLEEQVIPKLFAGKTDDGAIRVWSPGCSTGEEAYSIAILLAERREAIKKGLKVQVFATDIDRRAIATARAGIYPASIAADISPERLAYFFSMEPSGTAYCVQKVIRDMIVFSEQNVIKDPPFSKLDLISCRNLMIYMSGTLQKKLIPLFHYALKPGGFLFLGTSETVGEFSDLFDPVDRKLKLYRRKDDIHRAQKTSNLFFPLETTMDASPQRIVAKAAVRKKPMMRELTEQVLLNHVAPSAALVNSNGDILYLHGHTGMYLEPTPGEAGINNILKMAREGLRRELAIALHKAVSTKETVSIPHLNVKTNGAFTAVKLTVRPVIGRGNDATNDTPLYLVILEEALESVGSRQSTVVSNPKRNKPTTNDQRLTTNDHSLIAALKKELREKDEYLQSANEELETSNEELKSSNEEMQSGNEELQSTNEELETSKEELQSVNEELSTVNAELQTKVMDLSQTNNDMNNLLAGTGIATVFVDYKMRIMRFTPASTKIINLIPSDVGRPVGHILSNLVGYNRLTEDVQSVIDTLLPKEMEVQATDSTWYSMRIRPYRTMENVIEGAVISFVDITKMKLAQEALNRLAVVVRDSNDAIIVQDLIGNILAWNPAAERIFGWSEAEALKLNIRDTIAANLREDALKKIKQLLNSNVLEPYRVKRITKDGKTIDVLLTATALVDNAGKIYAISTTEREMSEKKLSVISDR